MNIKLGEQLLLATFSISIIFKKLYLVKMCPIFAGSPLFLFTNIKISFEYDDFYAKISIILDTSAKNFITQQTLLCILNAP